MLFHKFTNMVEGIKSRNISSMDLLLIYPLYAKRLLAKMIRIRNTFRNYRSILKDMRSKQYPVEAILRSNGQKMILNNTELAFIAYCKGYEKQVAYELENDIVMLTSNASCFSQGKNRQNYYDSDDKKKENQIKLYGAINNGDITSVFLHGDYQKLPVRDKTVIDIGANIGDSAIYFALQGAHEVIALEPFNKNYRLAKKNIELNNLSDRIVLLQAGCGSKKGGKITIDPSQQTSTISRLVSSQHGTSKIDLMSIKDIVDKYDVKQGSILKIDCEGCEYDVILPESTQTLQIFSHIQIEYHYGYNNLKEKLQKSGFKVSATIPKTDPRDVFKQPPYQKNYVGMLDAKQT
jgi:FkbM family methyltransferase